MEEMLRRHVEKVVQLSDEEYSFVRQYFTVKDFKKGSLIVEKNEMVRHAFLVISGLLKLIYHDQSGREHIISFAMEDWWETDYPAWLSGQPASLTLKCIEDTRVYCLSLDAYHTLCLRVKKMEQFFLHKANRGHLASQDRILSLLTDSPRERYELVLRKQPALMQRVPKAMLAAYLGLSRETLSRLWKKKQSD